MTRAGRAFSTAIPLGLAVSVSIGCAGSGGAPAPHGESQPSPSGGPTPVLPDVGSWLPFVVEPAPPLAGERPAEVRYRLLDDVVLAPDVERIVARLATAYYKRTGRELVVTSGTRDAVHQAAAVCELLRLGVNLAHRYRQADAARELVAAYERARREDKNETDMVTDLARVLTKQMERGVYLSAHLRAGAVDVRSRGMSRIEKQAFRESVEEVGGIDLLEEAAPPHFHLEVEAEE